MISLFGTIKRNLVSNNWSEQHQEEQWRHSGFLTSFGTNVEVHDGFRTMNKKTRHKSEKQSHTRNGLPRNYQHNIYLDQNRNVLVRLPKFNEKKIFLPVVNDRMSRTNQNIEALTRQHSHNESILTNYRLIKILGKGTFAKVKLAEHILTGYKVAIKIIDKSRLTDPDLRKIEREIEIMKCLNHPNIIRLYEVIEDSKYINIVMEYAARGEIYDYIIHKRQLTEDDARSKFKQLLSAIAYCHGKDIVHRDLKVENLLLDSDFNVKVCDFGFGNFFDRINKLDTFCGSPPYAAPELFRGDKYIGPEVDVWSLGVILFTFLTGSLPFNGKTLPALKSDVIKGNFTVPNYVRVGSEVFLRKFLKVLPKERITLQQALTEPWITRGFILGSLRKTSSLENPINTSVVEQMVNMGYQMDIICDSVDNKLYDNLHATYRILCLNNEVNSFYESFKTDKKDKQYKSELTLPQQLDASQGHICVSTQQINPTVYQQPANISINNSINKSINKSINNSISKSFNHQSHDQNLLNRRRRQTTEIKHLQRFSTSIGSDQLESFTRRYSVGVKPDLIISMEPHQIKDKKVARISSLSGNISPDVILKKEYNDQHTPRPQKSFKEMSRNLFKRTKNIDLTTKEEVGYFARLPSISLRNESNNSSFTTTVDNNNLSTNYSLAISHRLSLDNNGRDIHLNSFKKTPSKQSLSYLQNNRHPTVTAPLTFKEKFFELFRIKRH